ncbi:hypothetical protein [Nocardiopsis valliformis]|uniref:hypothetical protein n=1 Tax=Nocardiopsis valliformis TaxID=239974 RepID=UPI0003727373|nr:hypothetical protein [Nocardiopsis valliformis]
MYPQPAQPVPLPSPEQVPAPGQVKTVAVMIWLTFAFALIVFTFNMVGVALAGISPGYAFGYSLPWTLPATLLAVTAVPLVRGHSWARTMARVVLIIQIVVQSLALLGGTGFLWALFLLPMAITALIQLHHPMSKWFFAVHNPAANLKYLQQYTAVYYPQQQYPAQQYPHQQ